MAYFWYDGEEKDRNIYFYVSIRSLQLAFGYAGIWANLIVCILLLLFLIPLGINLAGAMNSLEVTNTNSSDPFDAFPVDPFPSSTICFTNSSIIDQEKRWENKTDPFSNSCNKTFEAKPCYEVRDTIITKVSLMIGVSSGVLLFVGGVFLFKLSSVVAMMTSGDGDEDEDGWHGWGHSDSKNGNKVTKVNRPSCFVLIKFFRSVG